MIEVQFHSFACSCPVFPAALTEEIIFASLYILTSFVKNRISIDAWVYLWAFYLVPLVFVSVLMSVPSSLDDYSLVVYYEVRKIDSSSSILLSQDFFVYLGSFVFPYEL